MSRNILPQFQRLHRSRRMMQAGIEPTAGQRYTYPACQHCILPVIMTGLAALLPYGLRHIVLNISKCMKCLTVKSLGYVFFLFLCQTVPVYCLAVFNNMNPYVHSNHLTTYLLQCLIVLFISRCRF
nr:MAG TPA: hypothetical protein [Caudoviricetes sp.]